MGVIAAVRRALERTAGRLDELERRARGGRSAGDADAAAGALSTGPALWRELASQEDLAYVRISGDRNAAGWWPARRQWFTQAGTCEDDPEFPEISIWAVGGAVPFRGAAGFVRFSGLRGSNDEPMWLTMAGEWHGFPATLSGPIDSSYSYGWTMAEAAPFRAALTHTSPGLGRAVDRASAGYEAVSGGMTRTSYPTGTHVLLRWDRSVSRMWFLGYSEPVTVDGCLP